MLVLDHQGPLLRGTSNQDGAKITVNSTGADPSWLEVPMQ